MAEWAKMAAGVLSLGFMLDMFAISGSGAITGANRAVEALEICGFLCLMIGCVLALASVFGDSKIKGNKGALIALTVFAFVAGLLIIIGFAIYGSRNRASIEPYQATLLVCAGALALAGGVFGALGIARPN